MNVRMPPTKVFPARKHTHMHAKLYNQFDLVREELELIIEG